jgi:hypothetical protein
MSNSFKDIPNPDLPTLDEFLELDTKIDDSAMLDGRPSTKEFSEAELKMTALDLHRYVSYNNAYVFNTTAKNALELGIARGLLKGIFFTSLFWIFVIIMILKYSGII